MAILKSRPKPADDLEAGLSKISPEAEDEKKKEQSVPLRQILLRKVKLCSWKKLLALLLALLLFAITVRRIAWNMTKVAAIKASAELSAILPELLSKQKPVAQVADTATKIVESVLALVSVCLKQKHGLPFSVPVLIASGVLGPLIGAAAFVPFFWRFDWKPRLHWRSLAGCFLVNLFSVQSSLQWQATGQTFLENFVLKWVLSRLGLALIRSIKLDDLGWRTTSELHFALHGLAFFFCSRLLGELSPAKKSSLEGNIAVWTLLLFASLVVVALWPATIFFLKANAMQRDAKERDTKEHASAHSELESQTWREICCLRLCAGLAVMDALCLPILHLLTENRTVSEAFLTRGVLLGNNGADAPFCVVDDAWVLFSILISGGVIGPQDVLKLIQAPNEWAYTARAKGKRVLFDIFAANTCWKSLKMLLALLLFVITVLRMVQRPNVKFYSWPYGSHLPMEDMEVLHVIFGLLRPLIGAATFVPFFWRFDWKSRLHWRSLAGCFLVNLFSVVLDSNVLLDVLDSNALLDVFREVFQEEQKWVLLEFVMLVRWMIRFFLVEVTGLKLHSLGWQVAGSGYRPAWICWVVLHGMLRISGIRFSLFHALDRVVLQVAALPILTLVPATILFREASAKQQYTKDHAPKDPELQTQASRTVSLLRLGACLTIIDSFYLPLVEIFWCDSSNFFNTVGALPTFCTIDDVFLLFSILVLGGMVGPRGALELDQVLDELAYMARTKGNRIAFPGRINSHSPHCIVSFPGSYAAEWDAAVRQVQLRSGAVSLACVFLTDPASGLGRHASNPDQPGCCWCRALYGHLTKEAYLSIVEEPSKLKQEELDFKKIDAAAMGQVFLVKQDSESDADWQVRKEAAEKEAEELCDQKQGLAPWGCEWFHLWKNRVKEAHRLGQTLHVFYFQGKVGQGKMAWADLANKALVKQVRQNTGLGGSQTAEVAYLEKSGYTFAEHDVADFFDFMEDHRHAVK